MGFGVLGVLGLGSRDFGGSGLRDFAAGLGFRGLGVLGFWGLGFRDCVVGASAFRFEGRRGILFYMGSA